MQCQEHRKWTYRAVSGDYCLTKASGLKGINSTGDIGTPINVSSISIIFALWLKSLILLQMGVVFN